MEKVMEEAPLAVGAGTGTQRADGGLEQGGGHPPGGAQVGPLLPQALGQAVQLPALPLSQFSTKDPSFQLPPRVKPTP